MVAGSLRTPRRVAVTGIGMVSPLGLSAGETWQGLTQGRSGIGPITRFDTEGQSVTIAGEVKGFRAEDFLPRKEARRTPLFMAYGVAAAQMAVEDARMPEGWTGDARTGVYAGCGIGGLEVMEENFRTLVSRGPGRVSPFLIPHFIGNMAGGMVAMHMGLRGPNLTFATACAAGAHAVGEAFRRIRDGYADVMLAGGSEAVVSPLCLAGFAAMKALSTRNDSPESASRPFDRDRDGFVVGEGACFLVLENLEKARERGARIYACIDGYGAGCDAYHITAPEPEGQGMAACMQAALLDGGVCPDQVGWVNAHGTGTPLNDVCETRAVKQVFGGHAQKLCITALKSMTGHLLGAAGGFAAGVSALALYHGILPPTRNLNHPDPECDLDYIPNQARSQDVKMALTNAFGFGGTNASLLMAVESGRERDIS
ncbi:beta-ketoacyl-ACP synthase II [Desulfobotulus sp. H1]|uniref:3-oxoacyl-[acyl-carrier-protein] synthase 2 n=1 Tax=Desulfobotulus pelophilus TaxID=2823377 RepID=A0ABT3N6Y4_9BACT|nr:beta-ketoacyl-ACP synthase II [Desulfobotulus pelophilus]MCW7753217.1 beta-ketoacyl-ACP synthase II [Desulfobotulus pelophilus]